MRTNTKSIVRPLGAASTAPAPRHDAVAPRASATPADEAPSREAWGRRLVLHAGKRLRSVLDPVIAASSLVSTDPVLDMRDFAWTETLRRNWQAIRDEALGVAMHSEVTISSDHRRLPRTGTLRSFILWENGPATDGNIARCPVTTALMRHIPALNSACFSILPPGTHIADRRGLTKGLITCHLGLIVPRDGDVRMRVGNRTVRWAEGETLVFDDTYSHEMWNDARGTRIVLLIRFARPLRNPGKAVAELVLRLIGRSDSVQETRDTIEIWNDTVKQRDV